MNLAEAYSTLPELLEYYENELLAIPGILTMKGKTLEVCLKEQTGWPATYGQHLATLKTLQKYVDMKTATVRSSLTRQYTEMYNPKLSERQAEKYIDGEVAFLQAAELGLLVGEMVMKYQAVMDAFTTRGYALRNISETRIAGVNSYE